MKILRNYWTKSDMNICCNEQWCFLKHFRMSIASGTLVMTSSVTESAWSQIIGVYSAFQYAHSFFTLRANVSIDLNICIHIVFLHFMRCFLRINRLVFSVFWFAFILELSWINMEVKEKCFLVVICYLSRPRV